MMHTCETCHHAFASTVLEDKPIFRLQREEFKGKEDTCDKWQVKHKERNC